MNRIAIKFFVAQPSDVDLGAIIPVFHQWIQQSKVPGLLIDVADYAHMVDGPGVLLVGHDVDYALDMANGRPGLLHRLKRSSFANITDGLSKAFRSALLACQLLGQDQSMRFRTDEVAVTFEDRLNAPNNAATFDKIRGEIAKVVESIYNGTAVRIEHDKSDERQCLTINITSPDAPDVDALIKRLAL